MCEVRQVQEAERNEWWAMVRYRWSMPRLGHNLDATKSLFRLHRIVRTVIKVRYRMASKSDNDRVSAVDILSRKIKMLVTLEAK
jgi:hypothetical protein